MEILSRLPLKSIGRCCCVSKLWASILGLPYFLDLFATRSSARPHMLFACRRDGKVLFFSAPQPQNFDVNSSSDVTANYLSHKVMTLGTQKLEWRRTKCCIPHYSYVKGICINGVLYYRSVRAYTHDSVIVCFDARSEEFSFIEVETTFKVPLICGQYINYNGKFGLLLSQGCDYADEASSSFELVVIGDSENQEWSTRKYVLPPTWKNMVKEKLGFVGFIGTHTIVLTHPSSYIIYYNIEKNTIVKVSIQGLDGFKCFEVLTFVDYVEDLRA
ncbi:hypothetical protein DY000_02001884 [Brassica cretica]|uniref:F-box associated domain-containing protein n=1 Tax=Brassica cretica TaxID=69181 RepID=A0ABQ7BV23_BRACR|nr:hypothetical protein DY000_02001884 [Brassica cretica]